MNKTVLGIAGWKNSGKTTLVERLVVELTLRGLRISTVKHAHHSFDLDQSGTDSFRHRAGGAVEVAIASSQRWAIMHELRGMDEPPLDELLARLSPCDLVIVEGWKRGGHPKIEVRRRKARDTRPLSDDDPSFIAVAADHDVDTQLPSFGIDEVSAIADFIIARFGLARRQQG